MSMYPMINEFYGAGEKKKKLKVYVCVGNFLTELDFFLSSVECFLEILLVLLFSVSDKMYY